MTTEMPETGRVRARCVWWLSGQCKGGRRCACLPEQWREPPADQEPDGDDTGDDTGADTGADNGAAGDDTGAAGAEPG